MSCWNRSSLFKSRALGSLSFPAFPLSKQPPKALSQSVPSPFRLFKYNLEQCLGIWLKVENYILQWKPYASVETTWLVITQAGQEWHWYSWRFWICVLPQPQVYLTTVQVCQGKPEHHWYRIISKWLRQGMSYSITPDTSPCTVLANGLLGRQCLTGLFSNVESELNGKLHPTQICFSFRNALPKEN